MVPRKVNILGKRNRTKIKSKMNKEKNNSKSLKKTKGSGKPAEDTKLHEKTSETESFKQSRPVWLQNGPYMVNMTPQSSVTESETDDQPPPNAAEDFSSSDVSEECNCDNITTDSTQNGILKQKPSSSVVANYIKSGMDQVASFIVESAIKFGEQHGVIVPDKTNPDTYEFAPTDQKFGEKIKKIRFKIPPKPSDVDNSRRSADNMDARKLKVGWGSVNSSKASHMESRSESLDNILPILNDIKEEDGVVKAESDNEDIYLEKSRKRRENGIRSRRKRLHESIETLSNKPSDYSNPGLKGKKFRRDSLELGRRRLRAANCSRKERSLSVTPS